MAKKKKKATEEKKNQWESKYWVTRICIVVVVMVAIGFKVKKAAAPASMSERYKNTILNIETTKEEMLKPHSIVRHMTDQISLAKGFILIAEANKNLQFAAELKYQIFVAQALHSIAAWRKFPLTVRESDAANRNMTLLLYKAHKILNYDISTTITTMKAKVQFLEEQIRDDKTKRAAEEFTRGLYCLAVNLTQSKPIIISSSKRQVSRFKKKLIDNRLHHFCLFSDNIIATSAVVNSTVSNSKEPERVVFHIVTHKINYKSMYFWFNNNSFRGASIEVQKVEDFIKHYESRSGLLMPFPKYPPNNLLNYLRFYIPDVFPALKKVVFLEDDVVVQKDLAPLFELDMKGKVMGSVERCSEEFERYRHYLNFSNPLISATAQVVNPNTCAWAFGVNVFNLSEWRMRNVTSVYHHWKDLNVDQRLWKNHGMLPVGLLTFHGLIKALDPIWHVMGLGYTEIDPQVIERGALLHFNGNPKPWLKSAFEKDRRTWDDNVNSKQRWSSKYYEIENHIPLWEKYVNYSHPVLWKCFIDDDLEF